MNLKNLIPWKKEERPLTRRREDIDPMTLLQRRMNSLFDDFFSDSSRDLWNGFSGGFAPQMEVSETDKEVRISAELPGLDEKDVEVSLSGNLLTIKGEKKEEKDEDKGDYRHSERSYGYFERTLQLPDGADVDKITAKCQKGVLKVTVPKKPEEQNARRKIELLGE